MKNKELDEIFKQFLDGKKATINAGNIFIGGSIERNLLLKYSDFSGLVCLDTLEYNSEKPYENIGSILIKNGIKSYKNETLFEELDNFNKTFYIRVANILPYNVKSFNVSYDKDKLWMLEIIHTNNTTTTIIVTNR